MKLVINKCYGGFSLSPAAIKRLAEMKGRECYSFTTEGFGDKQTFTPCPDPLALSGFSQMVVQCFDIPNPSETDKNALYSKHRLYSSPEDRADADLIRLVEEMGSEAASGGCAKLEIVEIPDGVSWEISDHDGMERVEESHRSWA